MMSENLETSPKLGHFVDNHDMKSFSGLSTVLVATIQEAKDRISQIEYIFCSQLFPTFQAETKNLHKKYIEARVEAENEWSEKENRYLRVIEELRVEKIMDQDTFKSKEDVWRKKEDSLLIQIDELKLENHKVHTENQQLVASLKQENTKLMNTEQLLNEFGIERKLFQGRVETLEKKHEEASELQGQLKRITEEMAEGKRLHEKLLHQVELKDYEMMLQKKKNRDVVDSFKRLKSQYNFLRNKFGVTTEKPSNLMEDNSYSSRPCQIPGTSNGPENRVPETCKISPKADEQKDDIGLHGKVNCYEGGTPIIQKTSPHSTIKSPTSISAYHIKSPVSIKAEASSSEKKTTIIQKASPHSTIKSPTSISAHHIKSPVSLKAEVASSEKKTGSCWRATRSREEPGGADPHDDFLDTPLENIRENLIRDPKAAEDHHPVPPPKDMELDYSDEETQDLNGEPPRKKPISIGKPEDRGFKYIEPVRKKADRENLKGIECKQCKKFYDAVLPNGDKNNSNNGNFRCEHLDGVSRHRYRFVPPSTPEGFWNIGFDSEI